MKGCLAALLALALLSGVSQVAACGSIASSTSDAAGRALLELTLRDPVAPTPPIPAPRLTPMAPIRLMALPAMPELGPYRWPIGPADRAWTRPGAGLPRPGRDAGLVPILPAAMGHRRGGALSGLDPGAPLGIDTEWPSLEWEAGFDRWALEKSWRSLLDATIDAHLDFARLIYPASISGVMTMAVTGYESGVDLFKIHEVGRGGLSPDVLDNIVPQSVLAWRILRGPLNAGWAQESFASYYDDGALRIWSRGSRSAGRWSPDGVADQRDLYGFDPGSSTFVRQFHETLVQRVSFSGARFQQMTRLAGSTPVPRMSSMRIPTPSPMALPRLQGSPGWHW